MKKEPEHATVLLEQARDTMSLTKLTPQHVHDRIERLMEQARKQSAEMDSEKT